MRVSGALGVTAVLTLAGCSLAVADEGERVGASGELVTRGDVALQRVVAVNESGEPEAVVSRVSARFLQLSAGLDDGWVEMLVDDGKVLPALGSCVVQAAGAIREPLPEAAPQGSIELLDVGDVVIHAGPSTMPLAARAFPDVGDLVSGVVYTSRDADTALPPDVPYLLETTGSALVRGFRIAVEPPAEPELVVNGELLRGGDPLLDDGAEVELEWRVEDDAIESDRILVEITPVRDRPSASTTSVRCLFPDGGEARVPALASLFESTEALVDLSVHRLRRIVAVLPEIDEAAVEFDFAVTGRLAVAPTLTAP